ANGQCRRYQAILNSVLSTIDSSVTCPATVVCEAPNPYLCSDGSCVALPNYCRPMLPCPAGTTMCTDLRCSGVNSTCIALLGQQCPPANPVLCPNGACRQSIRDCSFKLVGEDRQCTDP